MKKQILIGSLLAVFFCLPAKADGNKVWSVAAGWGFASYLSGGTGAFGQGFVNGLYHINDTWETGLAYQFGSSFSAFTAEVDYQLGAFYVGLFVGPSMTTGASGTTYGPQVGGDWDLGNGWEVGGVVAYQTLSWGSGGTYTGSLVQSALVPFADITYNF